MFDTYAARLCTFVINRAIKRADNINGDAGAYNRPSWNVESTDQHFRLGAGTKAGHQTKESHMHRVILNALGAMLLIASVCHGQSLADAARENRKQKTKDADATARVITGDDFSGPQEVTIHLVPGTSSTGQGTVVAPGRGKHGYAVTYLDATRFTGGGVLHITITVGDGASEASFDLYPQGARLPSEGFPNSLAGAHNVRSGAGAKIDYRFDHGGIFQLAAEGSWNSKPGDKNDYTFVVDTGGR